MTARLTPADLVPLRAPADTAFDRIDRIDRIDKIWIQDNLVHLENLVNRA